MTEDELQVYAEFLYRSAAEQAQKAADNDVDRQNRVLNGLMEKPTYSPWWALPQEVREMWFRAAKLADEQAEVNDALMSGK